MMFIVQLLTVLMSVDKVTVVMLRDIMLSVLMLSVLIFNCLRTESHYSKYLHAECHNAECCDRVKLILCINA
jgi:hypothetical protein